MANFKVCVRVQRKDGFWPVYIRVTHNRKVGYIKTDKIAVTGSISKSGDVEDPYVVKHCSRLMVHYIERLNKVNTSTWTVNEVIDYLKEDSDDICFSDYARLYHDKLIDTGHMRNAKNYELAYLHLERYAGTNKVMFSHLTTLFVEKWINSMSETKRAKEMYPICIRQIFKEACKEFNDYDNGVIRIKTNPWVKIDIPRADTPEKRAITPEECRDFFSAPIPDSPFKSPLEEYGRDVAMLVFCLAGINTVDLYKMQKKDYYNGIIHYKRSKTMRSRRDEAYMEMRVPSLIEHLFDKYKAKDDDPYLFCFHNRHTSSDSFCANVNIGIRKLCKSMGIAGRYCVYTFRHTWGTIAQNDCMASFSEVGFGMNHVGSNSVTRGYIKTDFSPAWELNDKVIEFVFFTDKKGHREICKEEVESFEKFSPKNLMRGTIFFRGRQLGQIEDIGYHNVEEMIKILVKFVPEDVPVRSMVQIKIENLDKKQSQFYERQKGKGF